MNGTNSPQTNSPAETRREPKTLHEIIAPNQKQIEDEQLSRDDFFDCIESLRLEDEEDKLLKSFNQARMNGDRRYSTTSSVYAEHTISSPENDQVLYRY